jgi:hypothetical protein
VHTYVTPAMDLWKLQCAHTHVALPTESVPIESVPIESVPIECVPIESVPIESVPIESVPIECVPIESVPMESVPIECVPRESVLTESDNPQNFHLRSLLVTSLDSLRCARAEVERSGVSLGHCWNSAWTRGGCVCGMSSM